MTAKNAKTLAIPAVLIAVSAAVHHLHRIIVAGGSIKLPPALYDGHAVGLW